MIIKINKKPTQKVRKSINFTVDNLNFIESLNRDGNRSFTINNLIELIREKVSDYVEQKGENISIDEAFKVIKQ